MHEDNHAWLAWARELQSIAQTGIRYSSDERFGGNQFDVERYVRIRQIAADMLAAGCGAPAGEVLSILERQIGDATPKVDVRGVVFHENRLLLVRERMDANRWTLPGGWADVNETPARTTEREVLEESGYVVRARKVLAVFDRELHHGPGMFSIYKLFFWCDLVGGEPRASSETSEPVFFAEDEIPADLSTGRVTREQIARFFEHLRDPLRSTDFD